MPMFTTTCDTSFECPGCGYKCPNPDYFEMDEGDEKECRKCGAACEVVEVEVQRDFTWQVKTPAPPVAGGTAGGGGG